MTDTSEVLAYELAADLFLDLYPEMHGLTREALIGKMHEAWPTGKQALEALRELCAVRAHRASEEGSKQH